jgi:penicillin-binding protein 2
MALPIASLLEEYYLTGEVKRQNVVDYVKSHNIYYPRYDK